MAQAVKTLFGQSVTVLWVAPVLNADGTAVTTAPRIMCYHPGLAWVTVVTLPVTSVDDAKKAVGLDLNEEPDGRLSVPYSIADSNIITIKRSIDYGRTWTQTETVTRPTA